MFHFLRAVAAFIFLLCGVMPQAALSKIIDPSLPIILESDASGRLNITIKGIPARTTPTTKLDLYLSSGSLLVPFAMNIPVMLPDADRTASFSVQLNELPQQALRLRGILHASTTKSLWLYVFPQGTLTAARESAHRYQKIDFDEDLSPYLISLIEELLQVKNTKSTTADTPSLRIVFVEGNSQSMRKFQVFEKRTETQEELIYTDVTAQFVGSPSRQYDFIQQIINLNKK